MGLTGNPRISCRALLLMCAFSLGGCSGSEADVPTLPSGSKQVLAAAQREAGPLGATRKLSSPNLVQRNEPLPSTWIPEPWTMLEADKLSRELTISWTTGCVEKNVVYLVEKADQVVIDVWLEPAHLDDDEECLAIAYRASGRVALFKPLGARRLLTHTVQAT